MSERRSIDAVVGRRRSLTMSFVAAVLLALAFGFGHRGNHAVRSLLLPGAGLYDRHHVVLGVSLTVVAIFSMYAWLQWGMDWFAIAVVLVSMGLSAALAGAARTGTLASVVRPSAAAHEFPLVVIVMGALSSIRLAWRRSWIGRRHTARVGVRLSAVDACRAIALAAIAHGATTTAATTTTPQTTTAPTVPPDLLDAVTRRCRRIGIAARGRVRGEPLRIDHAHVRAALALTRQLEPAAMDRFRRDATQALLGVPASEPGWVRLLDGTLAALALQRTGDDTAGVRWAEAIRGPLALRRGHRPQALWTPCGLRGPRAAPWEHAAATALARAAGWVNDDDWAALRRATLAAAARGNAVADDERLVAAGRLWLRFVDDDQARRIVGRVTIGRDPLAAALDAISRSAGPAATDPALRMPHPGPDRGSVSPLDAVQPRGDSDDHH